jgi:hypothetical protein
MSHFSFGGVPSLGNERLECKGCGEYTIHRWGACIHCGTKRPGTRYHRAAPLRRRKRTDPVTGI